MLNQVSETSTKIKGKSSDIVFEKVNDDYTIGKLGSFSVIFMDKNGYVNGSQLCTSFSKSYDVWSSRSLIKDLRKTLSDFMGLSEYCLTSRPDVEDPVYQGFYIHTRLVPHLARWCNYEQSVVVNEIVSLYEAAKLKSEIMNTQVKTLDKPEEPKLSKPTKQWRIKVHKNGPTDAYPYNVLVCDRSDSRSASLTYKVLHHHAVKIMDFDCLLEHPEKIIAFLHNSSKVRDYDKGTHHFHGHGFNLAEHATIEQFIEDIRVSFD